MIRTLQYVVVTLAVLTMGVSASAQMRITSSAFSNGGSIPSKYTCDAQNPPNPPLAFSGVPQNAKSLVLIVEDPDVPKSLIPTGIFVHWIVPDISPSSRGIAEGQGAQGTNGMGKAGYVGPCPPDREHRYFFTLYAMDEMVGKAKIIDRKSFEDDMKAHIIAKAEYMGRYNKMKK